MAEMQNLYTVAPTTRPTTIPINWSSELAYRYFAVSLLSEIATNKYADSLKMGDELDIHKVPVIDFIAVDAESALPRVEYTLDREKIKVRFALSTGNVAIPDITNVQSIVDLPEAIQAAIARQASVKLCKILLNLLPTYADPINVGNHAGMNEDVNLGSIESPLVITAENCPQLFSKLEVILDDQNVPAGLEVRSTVVPNWIKGMIKSSDWAPAYASGQAKHMAFMEREPDPEDGQNYSFFPDPICESKLCATTLLNSVKNSKGQIVYPIINLNKTAYHWVQQLDSFETLRDPNYHGSLLRAQIVFGDGVTNREGIAVAYVTKQDAE